MVNYIIVATIITGSFILAFIVLLNNPRNNLNKLFFVFSQMNAVWAFVNIMTSLNPNEFWVRGMYGTGAMVIVSSLVWVKCLLDEKFSFLKNSLFFLIGVLFLVLSLFTKLIIKSIDKIYFGYFDGSFGSLFPIYMILLIFIMTYLIYRLFTAIRISKGNKQAQLIYVTLGILFFAFAALFLSFILPFLNVTFFSQFDLLGSFIFVIFVAYSILKYRLMDIRLAISRSILYFLLVLIVALTFTFITFTTGQLLQGKGEILVTLIVSLIIVIGLDPLKKLLAKLTDKFFYKGKIDYQNVLRGIGEIIARELDLERLVKLIEENLTKEIKVKSVKLYLRLENKEGFLFSSADHKEEINPNDLVLKYLHEKKEMIITDELVRQKADAKLDEEKEKIDQLQELLDQRGAGLTVPIITEDKITAVFYVGQKLSGSTFSQEDINFFELLAPQVATALEKAKLFEEVQSAKENLEVLVEQRTLDLKEHNQYLTALQTLINLITRSLDFQKVMQTIADGIASELGFIGGLLSFINQEKNTIQVSAITNTPLTKKVLALVPLDPRRYAISLEEEDNLGVKAIKTQTIIADNRFYNFIKPALPAILIDKIQQVLGAHSVFAVPVYSEEKVIGVIDFILRKEVSEVTDVEKEMMKSLADQAGIVYRNLALYQRIQQANIELKDANIRLQQLDQAKSEFLSIASHQLRTPLTGIKGYLSMILDGDFGQVPVKLKTVLSDVFENTDRLARLISVFLNVSRIESGRFELEKKQIDIVKLMEEVIGEFKVAADKKNLKLSLTKPKKLIPYVLLDRDKIKDVVVNLVDNSVKYTPKGKVEVVLDQEDGLVKVMVKDTGVGIKKGEDRELFKKFVRGDGIAQIHTGGSGLGLYIAKKIVEAHGGKIWVESEGKGLGSSFIFTLPSTTV